jgi:uncharacterized protein (DUF1684 family)
VPTTSQSALNVTSWRREVHALYDAVRAEADHAAAHRLWVETRGRLFQEHPASPRMGEQRLQHAEYDPAYRFVLPLEPADPEEWTYATATDGDVPFVRVGRFGLPDLGSVDVWWLDSYGGGLFVPLKDASCGRTSYGAGRYLLDTVKGADLGRDTEGHWVVDLNFAYNPSCAYDPAWACPLAPAGNRVAGEVPVGELVPADG